MPKNVKKPKSPATEPASKSTMLVSRLKPKQSPDEAAAEMMVEGLGMNAITAAGYSKTLGELDLTECMAELIAETRQVQRGNLGGQEALLTAQAVTLNAMFTQLALQASKMTIVDQIDRFTRLAMKAQGQCRATVETLALIKGGPRAVFARQANFAAGPQQVNNNPPPEGVARASNLEPGPIELLEAHDARMDLGTPGEAVGRHSALAALAAVDRPENRRG